MFNHIRLVLVNTTHPGNIGAVARAMKNMGLSQLYLVAPKHFPHEDADARASGAEDILAQAIVTETFEEAISDCGVVIGSSARQRSRPILVLDAKACAQKILTEVPHTPVALVLGREHAGLTNEELDRCHYHVAIPSNPEFSSLNVAAAAQVLCYEIYAAAQLPSATPLPQTEEEYATAEQMAGFYAHLESVLKEIDFLDPHHPRQLMSQLRHLYQRARPNQRELNILRGILTATEKITARHL